MFTTGNGRYVDSNHQRVGVIHWVGENGVKATCQVYHKCVCWLTKTPLGRDRAEQDLVNWMREALGDQGADLAAHTESATELKIQYGMRIKRQRI